MTELRSVCIYCGASFGNQPRYAESARRLGRALAMRGITVVYGGGRVGLMGALADAALAAGGRVIGVIPTILRTVELAHQGCTELIATPSMHARKEKMFQLADGFIALPGGIGTLEGFFEILTWGQLGIHAKPSGILNTAGYFDALIAFLDHAVEEGFLLDAHRNSIMVESEPKALLERIRAWAPGDEAPLMGRTNR
jgi:uncharacterized protein (TIGR00730 family)